MPSDKDMKYILETTILSPRISSGQEIEFIVVSDQQEKDKIASFTATPFINTAPYLIVFISNIQMTRAEFGEEAEKFASIDAHLAMETMVIAAEEKKLNAALIFPQVGLQEVKGLLAIPENYNIEGIIAVGYAAEKQIEKLQPELSAVLHINKYKQ
jgi:nitroreductase